jgi:hypothetical protein
VDHHIFDTYNKILLSNPSNHHDPLSAVLIKGGTEAAGLGASSPTTPYGLPQWNEQSKITIMMNHNDKPFEGTI